jgi:hypothetical protein
MRILLVVLALTASLSLSRASPTEDQPPPRPAASVTAPSAAGGLPKLLRKLSVELLPNAHAAECTREGETCTSNEQCCPGLECSGGPPATCVEED